MKHNGTIQAISGEDNALAGFLINIFQKNPDAFKVKSALSEALENVVDLVIGNYLPYEKLVSSIQVFQVLGHETPEIKKLSLLTRKHDGFC